MLNMKEKENLVNEVISRSKMIRDTVFYGLCGGPLATITADLNVVKQKITFGAKLYCKALNGDLIL